MATIIQFTPALNTQVTGQLSGNQAVLTNNAVLANYFGGEGIIGQNSQVGVNNAQGYNNFSFQATLDGGAYSVIVTWSIYAQRYYVNIYNLSNVLVLSIPLIESPTEYDISMTAGYFTSKMIFRAGQNQFEITP